MASLSKVQSEQLIETLEHMPEGAFVEREDDGWKVTFTAYSDSVPQPAQ